MYIPKHFEAPSAAAVGDLIDNHAFGVLASTQGERLEISHAPFLRDGDDRLLCHLARNNPQASLIDGRTVAAIFTGPHAYVSPSWFADEGVPTWNYAAVHVTGEAAVFTGHERLRELVERLASVYEAAEPAPWVPQYDARKLDYIVGVEIRVSDVQAKFKMSQNRSAADRAGVVDALRARGTDHGTSVAAMMAEQLSTAGNNR